MSSLIAIPEAIRASAHALLQRHAAPLDGLQLALLATPDGFEVASLRLRSALEVNRLAAMAGSLMAMARAVGREIQHPECKRLVFETQGAQVIFQAVAGGFPCTVCLVLDEGAVLGRALWVSGEIAQGMLRTP